MAGGADRGARCAAIRDFSRLPGGAIQENRRLLAAFDGGALPGLQDLVLRTASADAPVPAWGRAEEFALLLAARAAGATVPEPLFLEASFPGPGGGPLGKPFLVARRVAGTADPRVLVRDPALDPRRPALAERIGRELARIHAIAPDAVPGGVDLGFLGAPPRSPARRRIAELLERIDALGEPSPALEWTLRRLAARAPGEPAGRPLPRRLQDRQPDGGRRRTHRRAGLGVRVLERPLEDMGWLRARCWRFGADAREAGGIGEWRDFLRGYEAERGAPAGDPAALAWWEALAAARWAIIAHGQGRRRAAGAEAVALMLTGRKAAEMEYDAAMQVRRIEARAEAAGDGR